MDETRVRGLLELAAAATEEPPSRVDVELARSRARRKLRWRRASLAGASAAAVVAVVVAAVAVPGSHGAAPGRGRAPEAHAQIIAPRQFSLVSPYAAFGWLPPGDSLDGGTLSPSNVYLTAGPGPSWALTVYTAGFCNLTSAQVLRQLGQSQRPRLNCANSAGGTVYPVTSVAAAQVDGHTAFWTMKHVYLIWQYADNGWAALAPPREAPALARRSRSPARSATARPAPRSSTRRSLSTCRPGGRSPTSTLQRTRGCCAPASTS